VILRVSDDSAVTVNRTYPEAHDIYRTATGILLLSEREEEVISAHIRENGIPENPTPSPWQIEEFREMLNTCRRQGYFYRETTDVFEAAAPIRDPRGIRTAVGIFQPLFRTENKEGLVAELLKVTEALEEALNPSKPQEN
jgi:DNA-binding IclR family transcriptional regulator